MNRKTRRAVGLKAQSATVTLGNLQDQPYRGHLRTSSITYMGRNDYELWHNIVGGSLSQLGIDGVELIIGFLARFINNMGPDVRQALAVCIVNGMDFEVQDVVEEKDGQEIHNVKVEFTPQQFAPLEQPKPREPGVDKKTGLLLPGGAR
jgi:hypothetical protein